MNVGELRELLEGVEDDVELRIAWQPSWPLAGTVAGVRCPGDDSDEQTCPEHPDYYTGHIIQPRQQNLEEGFVAGEVCDCEADEDERDRRQHCWIVQGDHHWDESPYAPRWVFEDE
jgi:hypothetical protein